MPPAAHATARPDTSIEPLRRSADFDALTREGIARRHRLFSVRVRRNGLGRVRYGFAVSRRVGGAVVRNRIRRRLRALMRELPPCGGYDVLVSARPPVAEASFEDIRQVLNTMVADALERTDARP